MADEKDFSWQVNYGEGPTSPMSLCFVGLNYDQSMVNGVGMATHTFRLGNRTGGGLGLDSVPPLLEKPEIEFEIVNSDGSQRQKWRHLIHSFEISYELRNGYPLTLYTMEMKGKMEFDCKNRAHRIESSYTDKAREIVLEHGLSPDLWEDQAVLPEHRKLRQINLTDYEWLVHHLAARMDKGYCLYSGEDAKINFHSPAYRAESYSVPKSLYLNVKEGNDLMSAIHMGGSHLEAVGYDPFTKTFRSSGPHGDNLAPSFGALPPLHAGLRRHFSAAATQEALDAAARTRNSWYAYQRQFLHVIMRGHIPEGGWWKHRTLDLGDTSYKQGNPQTGFTRSMFHAIDRGNYEVTALCGKDKAG